MRVLRHAIVALTIIGCRASTPAATPAATPSPAPALPLRGMVTSERVVAGPPLASDTSAQARSIRAAQRAAIDAAARVRSITVTPARIALAVGETVSFLRFQITALDSAGRRVDGFVPNISVQDNTMATLRGGNITALEPGTTSLRILPMTFSPTTGAPTSMPMSGQRVMASVTIDIAAPPMRTTVTRPPVGIDSMVPIELARYLIGGGRVVVGQPISVLDSNTLRGGYVHGSRYVGTTAASIVSYPWTRLATLDTLRRRLERAGWGPPPAPKVITQPGFQSSVFNTATGTSNVFCRNRDLMVVGVAGAYGTETVISLNYSTGQRTACDPQPQSPEASVGMSPVLTAVKLIPPLAPLPVGFISGTGTGGSNDEAHADARVMADLPVAEVMEHYRRQLVAAGWTSGERSNTSSAAVATFTFRDSTARSWNGALTVIGSPPSNRVDVRLTILLSADAQRRP